MRCDLVLVIPIFYQTKVFVVYKRWGGDTVSSAEIYVEDVRRHLHMSQYLRINIKKTNGGRSRYYTLATTLRRLSQSSFWHSHKNHYPWLCSSLDREKGCMAETKKLNAGPQGMYLMPASWGWVTTCKYVMAFISPICNVWILIVRQFRCGPIKLARPTR